MDYIDLINQLEKSDNPLIQKMVNSSEDIVSMYTKLLKEKMDEKDIIESILKRSIVQIRYIDKKGVEGKCICTSNPYFIAILSIKKFSTYLRLVNDIEKNLKNRKPSYFSSWNLEGNHPQKFSMRSSKINAINAIEISKDNIDLIEQLFKNFKPTKEKEDKNTNNQNKSNKKYTFKITEESFQKAFKI